MQTHPPSWIGSVVFHLCLLLLLAMVLKSAVPKPVSMQRTTGPVALVQKQQADSGAAMYTGVNQTKYTATAATDTSVVEQVAKSVSDIEVPSVSPLDSSISPQNHAVLGPSTGGGPSGGSVHTIGSGAASGAGAAILGSSGDGKGTVQFFNTTGKGRRFTFVLDRSASMAGRPFWAARNELLRTIDTLDETKIFSVVYFNELPFVCQPVAVAGDDFNRAAMRAAIGKIRPSGGTDHFAALNEALRIAAADVLFYLTDGEEKPLNEAELRQILRKAGATQINVIHFGSASVPPANSFLQRLASFSGGQYVYLPLDSF